MPGVRWDGVKNQLSSRMREVEKRDEREDEGGFIPLTKLPNDRKHPGGFEPLETAGIGSTCIWAAHWKALVAPLRCPLVSVSLQRFSFYVCVSLSLSNSREIIPVPQAV